MRSSSPLRPGQELTTGGRTALTQWEFYDALSQMYQAQVLLNVVRLVEYGEAPLHFKFSDFTATITDTGNIASGFEFFDNPLGVNVVGKTILGTGQKNVKFTPSLSLNRKVQIQAKATPVLGQDWIYDWYFTVADYFLEGGSSKEKRASKRSFYERFTGANAHCEALKASKEHRLALWYRSDLYSVREEYEQSVKDEMNPDHPDLMTPEGELGALTVLVSFLRESRPHLFGIRDFEFRIPVDFYRDPRKTLASSDKPRLLVKPARDRMATAASRKTLDELEDHLRRHPGLGTGYRFILTFPEGEGKEFATPNLNLLEMPKEGIWTFKSAGPPKFCNESDADGEKKPVSAGQERVCDKYKDKSRLRNNIDNYLKYVRKNPDAEREVSILIPIRRGVATLSLQELARKAARREGSPKPRKSDDILEEILDALNTVRVQLNDNE